MAKAKRVKSDEVEAEVLEIQEQVTAPIEEVKPKVMPTPIMDIVGGTPFTAPAQPKSEEVEGATFEERLVNFMKGKWDWIRLNEFLRAEFKSEISLQNTNKLIRLKLQGLIDKGVLEMRNAAYKNLGKHYYAGDTPVTQYYSAINTILEGKLK
jgi:hypothetical protein